MNIPLGRNGLFAAGAAASALLFWRARQRRRRREELEWEAEVMNAIEEGRSAADAPQPQQDERAPGP